jgi:hypothetical protein
MTEEEAAKLKEGDIVEIRIGGKIVRAKVEAEVSWWCNAYRGRKPIHIRVSRCGKTTVGGKYPSLLRDIKEITRFVSRPSETANVFADFLEENGHVEAADLLRREFPLGGIS